MAAALGGTALFMGLIFLRSGHFFRCLTFSAVTGLGGLLITSGFGSYAALPLLAVTPLSVGTSVTLGIPGVISMLVFRLMTLG